MRRALDAVILATLLPLAGCGTALAPASFEGRRPELRPERFFAGETRSTGVLETAGGAPSQLFSVAGHGRVLPGGRLELRQTVAFQGEPSRDRTWLLTATDGHHFTGSLSDASGPVEAEAYGDLLHLAYGLKGVPLGRMEQWLYLQPDGCTVMNEAVVRVAGVAVRRLSERISRVGGGC